MSTFVSNTKLNSKTTPSWCPGCGDFGIWMAFKDAAIKSAWNNSNSVLMAGIGCHGHIVNFLNISSFEGLHGRALPVASGMKMANHNLNVFVFTGDGDCLAEGGNHFIHTARRNHDLTVILHDNAVYGLTTGQTSPRSPKGFKSRSTPLGSFEEPLQPVTLAIAAGASFVARAYSGDMERLSQLIIQANAHKGFALIDVLQPCVTFNKMYSHNFYQKNTYHLPKEYDPSNKAAALEKSLEWDYNKIPLGIIYKSDALSYEEQIPVLKDKSLFEIGTSKKDISEQLQKFY